MTLRIELSSRFIADLIEFGIYCGEYSDGFAIRQFKRIDFAIRMSIADAPQRWPPFKQTGLPYRAYLFRVGARSQYWIVYTFDDFVDHLKILRLWGASRDGASFSAS